MLRLILKLFYAINSETAPGQISAGFCFAMFPGFTPWMRLHNLAVVVLLLVFRVNFAAFIVGLGLWSALGFGLDPMIHGVGDKLLNAPGLQPRWQAMYDSLWWRLTGFNNTTVLGGVVLAVVLFVPLFIVFRWLIVRYRERVQKWVMKSRAMTFLKASKLYRAYRAVAG